MKNSGYLHNPSYLELDDAYRGLAKFDEIIIKTDNLSTILRDMEKVGFVAILIADIDKNHNSWIIRGAKGKHGPCHFSGNTMAYKGVAKAALDDDLHLLPRNHPIEVCEKTRALLSLPAYDGLVDYSKENTSSHDSNIVDGDRDDFESLADNLYEQLKVTEKDSGKRRMLFYRGPFKLLVLEDGTLVRRGKWNAVPEGMTDQLVRKEGFIHADDVDVAAPTFLQDRYAVEGTSAFMDELSLEKIVSVDYTTDFTQLKKISPSLRQKLRNLIEREKKYFVLIGSDIADKLGCCPSKEVTEANMLVKSGILDSFAEPEQGDSCPLTFFGFKGELQLTDSGFDVNIKRSFRQNIHELLVKKSPLYRSVLKYMLLAFVAVSLFLSVRQMVLMLSSPAKTVSYEPLEPFIDGQVQLVLFHNEKRCFQCLQMEKFTRGVVDNFYNNGIAESNLVFKTMTIDDPQNNGLVDQFGIFAAALVVIEFKSGELAHEKVLKEATGLYRDEEAFKAHLHKALSEILR